MTKKSKIDSDFSCTSFGEVEFILADWLQPFYFLYAVCQKGYQTDSLKNSPGMITENIR